MDGAARIAVFAYGSLVSPASAAQTICRPERSAWAKGDAFPATLLGWRRRFSQARDNRSCEKTFALDVDGSIPEYVLGLNVEGTGDPADVVNGLLIVVTEAELERLDVRELRYDRVEVDPGSFGTKIAHASFDRVLTYTAKARNFAPDPPRGAVILRSYANAVEEAFAGLGPDEPAAYRKSTGPLPAEVVDAHLVEDRIPPGNPRGW